MPFTVHDAATKLLAGWRTVITLKGERRHALAHGAAPWPAKLLRPCIDNVPVPGQRLGVGNPRLQSGIGFASPL